MKVTEDIAAIERAPRAIVYLAVEWSVTERRSRPVVRSAVESLPDLGCEFFAVEEDGETTGPWLVSHGWPKCPGGNGSLLWFESGRRVATELLPGNVRPDDIVERTMALWGRTRRPQSDAPM